MKEILIWFSHINVIFFLFFVVIISILLNFSSYFNLVFGIFFSYTYGGCPNGLLYVYTKVFMIDGKWNQSNYSSRQPPIHPITHPSIHPSIHHPSIHSSIHQAMNQESYENWIVGFLIIWCSKVPKLAA